jgi:hypothetical protein
MQKRISVFWIKALAYVFAFEIKNNINTGWRKSQSFEKN